MSQKITPAQLRRRAFAEHVAGGCSATEAYRRAGYKAKGHSAEAAASVLMRNLEVQAVIAEAQAKASSSRIATAEQLKTFWTGVVAGTITEADGTPPKMSDRIKAAELLGKTQGLFVDRTKQEGDLTITIRRGTDAPAALQPKAST